MTKLKSKIVAEKPPETPPSIETAPLPGRTTKLDGLIKLLAQPEGASIEALMAVTGWQAHSVRGALAGSLRRKGHVIDSRKIDGHRIYRITSQALS